MTSLSKVLNHEQLDTLELLLNGAFSPVEGYLNQADHISVLKNHRLANGCLWPLPITLDLSPSEKRVAQLTKRILLLDQEERPIAELKVDDLYRLPIELNTQTNTTDTWYAAGKVEALNKRLHFMFNKDRYNVKQLKTELQGKGWQHVVTVQANPELDTADMKQACHWLKQMLDTDLPQGGLLIQLNSNEQAADFHQYIHKLRAMVRCSVVKQIKISLLPTLAQQLGSERSLLLQALIARNYGSTGFVINAHHPRQAVNFLLQYRDELGMDLIPVKYSTRKQVQAESSKLALAA